MHGKTCLSLLICHNRSLHNAPSSMMGIILARSCVEVEGLPKLLHKVAANMSFCGIGTCIPVVVDRCTCMQILIVAKESTHLLHA